VTERPTQRPEGALIQRAAERTRQSARQLAAKVGISDTRWRHIVNGYQPIGRGQSIEIVAPPDTLARMARAAGVTADQLREAGRGDAADELDAMGTEPTGEGAVDDLLDRIWAANIPGERKLALIKVLMRAEMSRQAVAEQLRVEQAAPNAGTA
jgi:transcriptional regulator with XRE-family HTH domain